MTPSARVLRRLLAFFPAVGLFLLISVNPLAQSGKLPAPASYVSDFAGVIDAQTKSRLENILQNLKEKSKIELFVATVDSPDEISVFSQQLARNWNIGAKTTRGKSLLLVVSTASKTSFTQFSRTAQAALPDGVLGEMTYRMRGPLSDGRFAEAIDSGVHVFATALAEKIGFNVADLDGFAVAANSPEVANDSSQPVLVKTKSEQQTRPRTVTEDAKSQSTPPAENPQTNPTPNETPSAEPSPSESPQTESTPEAKTEPTPAESPKTEPSPVESPKNEPAITKTLKANATTRVKPPAKKKTAAQIAEEDADESEEVELTLTLPLDKRAVKLKEWLDSHPDSKSRARATELLISTHAALGDQKLKNADIAGGIEQLLSAIDEADATISDQLFSGVIPQIPMNLYMRGEREAAIKAAQNVEAKFGTDPKRLLAVAGFYMGIEQGSETVRLAESAIKLAPDLAEAHRLRAIGLHISLRLDEAIAEYKDRKSTRL